MAFPKKRSRLSPPSPGFRLPRVPAPAAWAVLLACVFGLSGLSAGCGTEVPEGEVEVEDGGGDRYEDAEPEY